jgi:hypothetical protein
MRIYHVIGAAVVLGTAVPIGLHRHLHGTFNAHQMGLAFFLWLNTIIAFWEVCLFRRIDLAEAQHARFATEYRGRELDRVREFFLTPVSPGQMFSPVVWAELWSTYSVFDESYANRRSFGFFIDVGNGFSTPIPSLLVLYGMTFDILPARALGLIALLLLYQMWYGTVVYFGSYLFNKRYLGHSPGNVALFVGLSNGIWLLFPLWGMGVAIALIYGDSFALLRG